MNTQLATLCPVCGSVHTSHMKRMSEERATYIWEHKLMGGDLRMAFVPSYAGESYRTYPDGITHDEDKFLHRVWNEMGGNTCYADALLAIARGELR